MTSQSVALLYYVATGLRARKGEARDLVNCQTVRRLGALLGTGALCWGFVQAPFLHIHADDQDHATAPPVHVHYHLAQKAPAPAVDSRDDDAIELEWSATAPSGIDLHFDAGPPERAFVAPVTFPSVAIQVPQYRGHDPPDLSPKKSRAPPA